MWETCVLIAFLMQIKQRCCASVRGLKKAPRGARRRGQVSTGGLWTALMQDARDELTMEDGSRAVVLDERQDITQCIGETLLWVANEGETTQAVVAAAQKLIGAC